MNLKELKKELPYKWRVQSVRYGKATCVAYIDARDAQDLLDEVCGPENWQSIFYEENGLLFCKVGICCNGAFPYLKDGKDVEQMMNLNHGCGNQTQALNLM